MEYEFHPLADLFPMMTDEELDELGEDMLKHGQREPIWLYEGKILDGRNRYRACLMKSIEPRTTETRVADPLAFVISLNLKRRHLDESQRAMVMARIARLPKGVRSDSSIALSVPTQNKAAKLLNVSVAGGKRARVVIEKGVPGLADAVDRGEVSVSSAAAFATSTAPIDQARIIADHGSPAAAVKAAVRAKADRAAVKTQKRKADVTAAADRAEVKAAAKAASSDNTLIGLLMLFERMREPIDLDAAIGDLSKTDLANMNALITRAHVWMGIVENKVRACARIVAARVAVTDSAGQRTGESRVTADASPRDRTGG
jgi:hypothetical protein